MRAKNFCRCSATFFVLAFLLPVKLAYGIGTPAGTNITTSAQATYSIAGVPAPPITGSVTITVDEIISVRVTPPAAATTVVSPDVNRVLAFTVTNVGNGTEIFTLTPNYAVAGDQFDPTAPPSTMFLDNGNGIFDPGDTAITAPVTLTRDQTIRVFVVASIPVGQADGNQGRVTLTAVSNTPGAAPASVGAPVGTQLPGQGTNPSGPNVDAVVGIGSGGAADSGADDTAIGIFVVSSVNVALVKSVLSVTDPFGNACAVAPPNNSACFVPGAAVTYRITVTVSSPSSAVAQNVTVTDAIPANTTYVAASILVNGAPRTDTAADADGASCAACGNATGALTVSFGNITGTAGGVVNTVDYRLTIN